MTPPPLVWLGYKTRLGHQWNVIFVVYRTMSSITTEVEGFCCWPFFDTFLCLHFVPHFQEKAWTRRWEEKSANSRVKQHKAPSLSMLLFPSISFYASLSMLLLHISNSRLLSSLRFLRFLCSIRWFGSNPVHPGQLVYHEFKKFLVHEWGQFIPVKYSVRITLGKGINEQVFEADLTAKKWWFHVLSITGFQSQWSVRCICCFDLIVQLHNVATTI